MMNVILVRVGWRRQGGGGGRGLREGGRPSVFSLTTIVKRGAISLAGVRRVRCCLLITTNEFYDCCSGQNNYLDCYRCRLITFPRFILYGNSFNSYESHWQNYRLFKALLRYNIEHTALRSTLSFASRY